MESFGNNVWWIQSNPNIQYKVLHYFLHDYTIDWLTVFILLVTFIIFSHTSNKYLNGHEILFYYVRRASMAFQKWRDLMNFVK